MQPRVLYWRDDGCACGSGTKLAVVYADSPHIHLLQSVANQSKVKESKTREYSQPLLFACAYKYNRLTVQDYSSSSTG